MTTWGQSRFASWGSLLHHRDVIGRELHPDESHPSGEGECPHHGLRVRFGQCVTGLRGAMIPTRHEAEGEEECKGSKSKIDARHPLFSSLPRPRRSTCSASDKARRRAGRAGSGADNAVLLNGSRRGTPSRWSGPPWRSSVCPFVLADPVHPCEGIRGGLGSHHLGVGAESVGTPAIRLGLQVRAAVRAQEGGLHRRLDPPFETAGSTPPPTKPRSGSGIRARPSPSLRGQPGRVPSAGRR